MSVWARIKRLVKVKLSKRNRPSDPLRVLQRDLELMDEQVRQVKSNCLALGKHKIQLEHRIRDLGKHADRYQNEARRALRLDREDLAKLALANKQNTATTQRQLQRQAEALGQRIAEFERLKEELINKIMIFKIKRDELTLSRSTAQVELSAEEMRLGLSLDGDYADSREALHELESEIRQIQARVDATRQLSGEALPPPLELEHGEPLPPEVGRELEALKREVRRDGAGDTD